MLRPVLEAVPPYDAGPPSGPREVRLSHNESPRPPPAFVVEAAAAAARRSHRYPDPGHRALKGALAGYTGLPAECISAGAGASGVLDTLCALSLEPLDPAVIPVPTYGMYGFLAMLRGASLAYVESGPGFQVEPEMVIEAARGARAVFLCSPNNPTGAAILEKDILTVAEGTDALVVVDEAYYEFSGRTVAHRVREFENLAVVRSMSKAFRLAGFRIGYALAHPNVADALERARLPFNLGEPAMAAATAALGRPEGFLKQVKEAIRERGRVGAAAAKVSGVRAFPSEANFLLLHAPDVTAEGLARRGVRVRDLGGVVGLGSGYLRVTVGTEKENGRFLEALRESAAAAPQRRPAPSLTRP